MSAAPSDDDFTPSDAPEYDAGSLLAMFETEWRRGRRPDLSAWLQRFGMLPASLALVKLIEIELRCRRELGENPTSEEYAQRFPNDSEAINQAFDVVESESRRTGDNWSAQTVDLPNSTVVDDTGLYWSPGQTIGRYVLECKVGRGGYGEVWKAHDPLTRRVVAIKLPRLDLQLSESARARCAQETQLALTVKDEGVVDVYEVGELPEGFYIVSEFIEGRTLGDLIKADRIPFRAKSH